MDEYLYHFTSIESAIRILSTGKLLANIPQFGADMSALDKFNQKQGKKAQNGAYISFTRINTVQWGYTRNISNAKLINEGNNSSNFLKNFSEEGWFFIILGSPGSGKNHFVNAYMGKNKENSAFFDIDEEISDIIRKGGNNRKANLPTAKSNLISKETSFFRDYRLNNNYTKNAFYFSCGTDYSQISKIISLARNNGYKIGLIWCICDFKTSLYRDIERAKISKANRNTTIRNAYGFSSLFEKFKESNITTYDIMSDCLATNKWVVLTNNDSPIIYQINEGFSVEDFLNNVLLPEKILDVSTEDNKGKKYSFNFAKAIDSHKQDKTIDIHSRVSTPNSNQKYGVRFVFSKNAIKKDWGNNLVSFNYFTDDNDKFSKQKAAQTTNGGNLSSYLSQSEERLWLPKYMYTENENGAVKCDPFIEILKYLVCVDVCCKRRDEEYCGQLKTICMKKNIPLSVFNDISDFDKSITLRGMEARFSQTSFMGAFADGGKTFQAFLRIKEKLSKKDRFNEITPSEVDDNMTQDGSDSFNLQPRQEDNLAYFAVLYVFDGLFNRGFFNHNIKNTAKQINEKNEIGSLGGIVDIADKIKFNKLQIANEKQIKSVIDYIFSDYSDSITSDIKERIFDKAKESTFFDIVGIIAMSGFHLEGLTKFMYLQKRLEELANDTPLSRFKTAGWKWCKMLLGKRISKNIRKAAKNKGENIASDGKKSKEAYTSPIISNINIDGTGFNEISLHRLLSFYNAKKDIPLFLRIFYDRDDLNHYIPNAVAALSEKFPNSQEFIIKAKNTLDKEYGINEEV